LSFIRVAKPSGAPVVLDRFSELVRTDMTATGRPASTPAPQAAALIRHVSEATATGASSEPAAARGLRRYPSQSSARELCHRQQACSTEATMTPKRALDATSWLKAPPQVVKPTSHLAASQDERCS